MEQAEGEGEVGMTEQEKREKVIKGLECCIKYPNEYGDCMGGDCPYGPRIGCHEELMRDALALLKTREPVKPIMHYVPDGKRSSAAWQCGNCLIDIGYGANYCYNCGRAVKWE